MSRADGRKNNVMRPVKITRGINKYAEGSVLIEVGDTIVLCTATVEERLPNWRRLEGKEGWVTAEYGMLPRSTSKRMLRDNVRRVNGRSLEIQRLIGRSLRSVTDLAALGEHTITLDCDVIQADGGTRTASITGAYVALAEAVANMYKAGVIASYPLLDIVAATSVGLLNGEAMLDLCYAEDVAAEVDMNVVMTGQGGFVEIQGTGEEASFTRAQNDLLLDLARDGIMALVAYQKEILGPPPVIKGVGS